MHSLAKKRRALAVVADGVVGETEDEVVAVTVACGVPLLVDEPVFALFL